MTRRSAGRGPCGAAARRDAASPRQEPPGLAPAAPRALAAAQSRVPVGKPVTRGSRASVASAISRSLRTRFASLRRPLQRQPRRSARLPRPHGVVVGAASPGVVVSGAPGRRGAGGGGAGLPGAGAGRRRHRRRRPGASTAPAVCARTPSSRLRLLSCRARNAWRTGRHRGGLRAVLRRAGRGGARGSGGVTTGRGAVRKIGRAGLLRRRAAAAALRSRAARCTGTGAATRGGACPLRVRNSRHALTSRCENAPLRSLGARQTTRATQRWLRWLRCARRCLPRSWRTRCARASGVTRRLWPRGSSTAEQRPTQRTEHGRKSASSSGERRRRPQPRGKPCAQASSTGAQLMKRLPWLRVLITAVCAQV